MKKQIIINIICGIIGAVVIATAFLSYTFYKEILTVNADHATLAQIVNLINQSQQK